MQGALISPDITSLFRLFRFFDQWFILRVCCDLRTLIMTYELWVMTYQCQWLRNLVLPHLNFQHPYITANISINLIKFHKWPMLSQINPNYHTSSPKFQNAEICVPGVNFKLGILDKNLIRTCNFSLKIGSHFSSSTMKVSTAANNGRLIV